VAGGALFKRIEEEKGLGGWAPASRRGIRTVGITDSAITRQEEVIGRLLARHAGQVRQARERARPSPAPGYRPESLDVLFGEGRW
jgi:hypothetical protein